jgi:hypothetical protein
LIANLSAANQYKAAHLQQPEIAALVAKAKFIYFGNIVVLQSLALFYVTAVHFNLTVIPAQVSYHFNQVVSLLLYPRVLRRKK